MNEITIPLGIYLHWPFCEARCPYCDFNAYATTEFDVDEWSRCYGIELDRLARESADRTCQTVFFGGGTPSLMPPELVASVLDRIDRDWGFANDAEITLEANPSSSDAERFAGYAAAGVNRLSIGVQSLRNTDLVRLGRLHSACEARRAVETAASQFARLSIDLMFGRPNQTLVEWRQELTETVQLGTEHLSLYQLTVEPGTMFGARLATGRLPGLPDQDLAVDLHAAAMEICGQNGLDRYEISNFARPGAQCRHNLLYWRGHDYLGIGPGAHGRMTIDGQRAATETILAPAEWLSAVSERGTGESRRNWLSPDEQASEYLMMSLRLAEGADRLRLRQLTSHIPNQEQLDLLRELGQIEVAHERLVATTGGSLVLNSLISALLSPQVRQPATI